MKKENIIFILDGSQMANNVAQAARAMANFGFRKLRLVNPLNLPSAERMARGGAEVVREAVQFSSLDDALADLKWVLGTTGKQVVGSREELVRPEEGLAELAGISDKGPVGIVFGCENHGLTTGQLKTMDRLTHIPTHGDCLSINLAQSVAILSWELEKSVLGAPLALDGGLPSHQKRQQLFLKVDQLMSQANVSPRGRKQVLVDGVRQFLNRRPLNDKDLSLLLRALNLLQKRSEESD
ncbi:MAG: RNA methyltransferase [candidate division FCPU426 bacterium]